MANTKNKLAENLQFLMQHYGLTETEISRRTQVGQPVVHRMAYGTTDNPKIKTISPVANLFGLSISQLLRDIPPPDQLQAELSDNVNFGWHAVPLVSLEDLPKGLAAAMQKSSKRTHTDIPPTDATFAIELKDESMLPQFPPKSICIIEPGLTPENDDFAVMVLAGKKSAVFRRVLFHGDDIYCQALNEAVGTQRIDGDYQCLGTMIQARIELV